MYYPRFEGLARINNDDEDIPRLHKKNLPEYQRLKESSFEMIYSKFLGSRLTTEEYRQHKEINDVRCGMTRSIS